MRTPPSDSRRVIVAITELLIAWFDAESRHLPSYIASRRSSSALSHRMIALAILSSVSLLEKVPAEAFTSIIGMAIFLSLQGPRAFWAMAKPSTMVVSAADAIS